MTDDKFVALHSRWRAALAVFGCCGFLAVSIWLLSAEDLPVTVALAAWACVAFAVIFGAFWGMAFFKTGPLIQIDSEGIYFSRWSGQTIPWNAISDIRFRKMGRHKMAIVNLHHPENYPGSGLLGMLSSINRNMGGGDLAIIPAGSNKSGQQLLDAIEYYAPRLEQEEPL